MLITRQNFYLEIHDAFTIIALNDDKGSFMFTIRDFYETWLIVAVDAKVVVQRCFIQNSYFAFW